MPEGKIKAKDLSYDASLPPFLQRLHAQNSGRGDQDRHERPIARPTRAKANDEEDEPTVVDEDGETVTKADLEKMTAVEKGETDGQDDSAELNRRSINEPKAPSTIQDGKQRADQKVTDGTAMKKRKVAKVVGVDEDLATGGIEREEESSPKKVVKKPKKKAKPIKLAFEDGDET